MTKIDIVQGDICAESADAIVNAANGDLMPGSGVNGAIHNAAGPELRDALRAIGGCPTGEAVLTPGFQLDCRFIIHTVGPIWHGGSLGEEQLLTRCYRSCFELAHEHSLMSVAFPAISTGVYGYPPHLATAVALGAIHEYAKIDLVRVVAFDDRTYELYRAEVRKWNG